MTPALLLALAVAAPAADKDKEKQKPTRPTTPDTKSTKLATSAPNGARRAATPGISQSMCRGVRSGATPDGRTGAGEE